MKTLRIIGDESRFMIPNSYPFFNSKLFHINKKAFIANLKCKLFQSTPFKQNWENFTGPLADSINNSLGQTSVRLTQHNKSTSTMTATMHMQLVQNHFFDKSNSKVMYHLRGLEKYAEKVCFYK